MNDVGIVFSVDIPRIPPQIRITPFIHSTVTLHKFSMEFMKRNFLIFRKSMCRIDGLPTPCLKDLELLQYWVDNLWQSIYNPIIAVKTLDGSYMLYNGNHRVMVMSRMGASHMWVYEYSGPMSAYRRTRGAQIQQNARMPRRGEREMICIQCGGKHVPTKVDRHLFFSCPCGHRERFISYPRSMNRVYELRRCYPSAV